MKRKKAKARPRKEQAIHRLLIDLREGIGMNQSEFADALGVDKTTVNHWENFGAKPALSRLPDIARVTGCKVGKLMDAMLESAA